MTSQTARANVMIYYRCIGNCQSHFEASLQSKTKGLLGIRDRDNTGNGTRAASVLYRT